MPPPPPSQPRRYRVGINGFGRMGRLTARILLLRGQELGMELVHVNELLGNAESAAYMLEFDTTHGRFPFPVSHRNDDVILVGEQEVRFSNEPDASRIPWQQPLDLVFECTGAILTVQKLNQHLDNPCVVAAASPRGLRVVVSAPVEGVPNIVMGCNDHLVQRDTVVCTAASCTTNCAAPVVGAIDRALGGIEMGSINTIHNVTPTQTLLDTINPGKKNDVRRGRSGASNLAPTTTGSAKAITMIYPHLKGKLNGLAVRVPVQNASLTDLVLVVKRDTTAEEVNAVLTKASQAMPRVLGVETRPLVSSDYVNDARSSIVDLLSTQVVNGRMVKILAWYDNEWGYVNRMVDLAQLVLAKRDGDAAAAAKL